MNMKMNEIKDYISNKPLYHMARNKINMIWYTRWRHTYLIRVKTKGTFLSINCYLATCLV